MAETALEKLRRLEAQRAAEAAAAREALQETIERAKAGKAAAAGKDAWPTAGSGAGDGGSRAATGGLLAVAIAFIVTKGKLLLLGLQSLKLSSLLVTFGTMGASILAYAQFYGLALAAGLCVLILVHELGHAVVAKSLGLRVGAPFFIPFIGAAVAIRGQRRTAWMDALIGMGGPIAGTLGGAAALGLGLASDDPGWRRLLVVTAWFTFILNLFNLAPILGLDGDHATRALRPRAWLLGMGALALVMLATGGATDRTNVYLLAIIALGAWRALAAARADPATLPPIEPCQRRMAASLYFGVASVLALLATFAHAQLPALPEG